MGGSTTQPMGASSLMGGANPMGQGAPQGQQEAQQRYDQAGGQGGQGAPQDMSRYAGNAMYGPSDAQQGRQQSAQDMYANPSVSNGPTAQGQSAPQDMSQFAGNGMMGMMGQGGQGQQFAQQRYDQAGGQGGQGAPQDMSQFAGNGGAGKGSVNSGAPGNYPPPPGYGPGEGAMPRMMKQDAPQDMSQFAGNGMMGMMGQQAPQNIPQFLQQNYPAMGAFPQLGTQAGAQGNIPIQAGARAPVAFGSPNPMGAPMLSELVKAPPPKEQNPQDEYNSLYDPNNQWQTSAKSGGAIHPQDSHTVIQNALRLLSNRN